MGLISAYDALNVNDLASLSGIPKSSVYVLLSEMERQRLIRQKEDGSYQLWVRVIELGQLASAKLDLREIVTDAMRENRSKANSHLVREFTRANQSFLVKKLENP